MTRVWTAAVLVPLVLAAVIWAPPDLFTVLIVLVALLALHEYFGLARASGLTPFRWLGGIGAAAAVVLLALPIPPSEWVALLAVLVVALAVRALTEPEAMPRAMANAGVTLLGIVYLGVFTGLLCSIRNQNDGVVWLIFMLVVVWAGDTAALYAGRSWGRHRMAPRVSPQKTWEGAGASFVMAVLLGAGFGAWTNVGFSALPVIELAALGGGINVAAQVGDLFESLLKRGAQVKDSGHWLAGHGGVLDRIDAMLFAAPLVWYYVAYLH
ncbi:MAG: phosphatidate cytidylyltransferase [Terriglobales bacterium]